MTFWQRIKQLFTGRSGRQAAAEKRLPPPIPVTKASAEYRGYLSEAYAMLRMRGKADLLLLKTVRAMATDPNWDGESLEQAKWVVEFEGDESELKLTKHLENATALILLAAACEELGWQAPAVFTPREIDRLIAFLGPNWPAVRPAVIRQPAAWKVDQPEADKAPEPAAADAQPEEPAEAPQPVAQPEPPVNSAEEQTPEQTEPTPPAPTPATPEPAPQDAPEPAPKRGFKINLKKVLKVVFVVQLVALVGAGLYLLATMGLRAMASAAWHWLTALTVSALLLTILKWVLIAVAIMLILYLLMKLLKNLFSGAQSRQQKQQQQQQQQGGQQQSGQQQNAQQQGGQQQDGQQQNQQQGQQPAGTENAADQPQPQQQGAADNNQQDTAENKPSDGQNKPEDAAAADDKSAAEQSDSNTPHEDASDSDASGDASGQNQQQKPSQETEAVADKVLDMDKDAPEKAATPDDDQRLKGATDDAETAEHTNRPDGQMDDAATSATPEGTQGNEQATADGEGTGATPDANAEDGDAAGDAGADRDGGPLGLTDGAAGSGGGSSNADRRQPGSAKDQKTEYGESDTGDTADTAARDTENGDAGRGEKIGELSLDGTDHAAAADSEEALALKEDELSEDAIRANIKAYLEELNQNAENAEDDEVSEEEVEAFLQRILQEAAEAEEAGLDNPLEASRSHGGVYTTFERIEKQINQLDRKKVREVSDRLSKLLDTMDLCGDDPSPRLDPELVAREVVMRRGRIANVRRRELQLGVKLLMVDVSGSCAEVSSYVLLAAAATLRQDPNAVLVVHSNGYPVEIYGQNAGKLLSPEMVRSGDMMDWWQRLLRQLDPISGAVNWGDWDAGYVLELLANSGVKLVWLDHDSRGKVRRADADQRARAASWRKQPLAWYMGINDVNGTALALRLAEQEIRHGFSKGA